MSSTSAIPVKIQTNLSEIVALLKKAQIQAKQLNETIQEINNFRAVILVVCWTGYLKG